MTIAVGKIETKDRWATVIELTNDDSSETKITVACRTLDGEWKIVNSNTVMSADVLCRFPASLAKHFLAGLAGAIYHCP